MIKFNWKIGWKVWERDATGATTIFIDSLLLYVLLVYFIWKQL